MKLIGLSFLIALPFIGFTQERMVLDWNFFKNDRPANAPHQAFTWYNLGYTVKFVKSEGEQLFFQFDVSFKPDQARSYFDFGRKRAQDYDLMKHEQGHADIGFLYALKLQKALAKGPFFKKDYDYAIKRIFNDVCESMNAENLRYDQETEHGNHKMRQQNWNEHLQSEMSFASIK